MSESLIFFQHLEKVSTSRIPVVGIDIFRRSILGAVAEGCRLVAYYGAPQTGAAVRLVAILAEDRSGELRILSAEPGESYPSLTPDCPQAADSSGRSRSSGV